MARADNDTWDLASSVGTTATMVAAGRALATKQAHGLIDDPFAGPLVRAVGVEFFTKLVDGDIDVSAIDNVPPDRVQAMIDGMAVRTKFFDDYFIDAANAGVRQAVILASGLDARAYRLPWPAGSVVYEVDQPQVIEFKTATLDGLGATPTAMRRTVAIDLRNDWPAALRAAGLDTTEPVAWLAEGLLIYLPPQDQDRLFDDLTALSAPGSTIATEYVAGIADLDAERAREQSAPLRDYGVDIDMPSLVYSGERHHVVDYLRGKGWAPHGVSRTELFTRDGLQVPESDDDPFGEITFVAGTLAG